MSILKIRDENGNEQEILVIKGKNGKDGDNYILTEADKQEIAELVYDMVRTNAASLINEDGGEDKEAVIINFSIEDIKFQAEEGMTWREWANSEYNSEGACVYKEGEDVIYFVEYALNVLASNIPVKGSDTIISGYFYYLS